MARNPVNPNTVVTIPERSVRPRTTPARKPPKIEEDTDHLHRTILQLRLWVPSPPSVILPKACPTAASVSTTVSPQLQVLVMEPAWVQVAATVTSDQV